MDLKQYFRKIRQAEAALLDKFPLVVSLETPDGGKPGLISEIPRSEAAKLIVEGRAVLASEEEKEFYRHQQACAKDAAERAAIAKRVQIAIVSDPDLKRQVSAVNDDSCTTGK